MLDRIRQAPSPALVIATLALIFAVGGGTFAVAANEKKQIKKIAKKVAKKQIKKSAPNLSVKSADSADTATTAESVTGLGGPLAEGETLTGSIALGGHKTGGTDFVAEDAGTFAVPLPGSPTAEFVALGGPPTTNCPGDASDPQAAPGVLCVYLTLQTGFANLSLAADRFGFAAFPLGVPSATNYEARGNWAVTAPAPAKVKAKAPEVVGQGG